MIRKIIRGAGYLPGYGEHPGTAMLIGLTVLTGAAGAQGGGWWGFLVGCAFGAVIYGPMWAAGCIGRVNDYERRTAQVGTRRMAETGTGSGRSPSDAVLTAGKDASNV